MSWDIWKTRVQREIKELHCPVSADESQIKEVGIVLFQHFDLLLLE
jgi:hypothetical protein